MPLKTLKSLNSKRNTVNNRINGVNKRKTHKTHKTHSPTFAIYLNEKEKIDPITTLHFSVLEKLLLKYNFAKREPLKDKSIDCLITYIRMPRELYNIKTILQNNMDDRVLALKSSLYNLSDRYNHTKTLEYFLYSEVINKSRLESYRSLFEKKSKNNDDNYIWILKGDQSYGGSGNFIVSKYNEFKKIVNENRFGFLLSKYLTKPLLFHRKKFHLRLYVINFIDNNNQTQVFLSKYGFIYTAKKEYVNKDYDDKDIHDSHFKSTETDYIFPNEFINEYGIVKYKNVESQIMGIISYIAEIQSINIQKFDDVPFAYNILGYDFIITEDYQVKLLEINTKTGLYTKTDVIREKMSEYLFTNIYNNIISEAFNTPKEPIEEDFIKIV
jgi:hypothetical protein